MIRQVLCSDCRSVVHESETREMIGPRGQGRLCPDCRFECREPTLPNAAQVIAQLRNGTGMGA